MRKIAKTEEFVRLIIFLASTYSSYVNGTAIAIDGGSSKSIFYVRIRTKTDSQYRNHRRFYMIK